MLLTANSFETRSETDVVPAFPANDNNGWFFLVSSGTQNPFSKLPENFLHPPPKL